MDSFRINSFSRYCREKFDCSVGKISLDLGVVCPNRQKGGCVYCFPPAFSAEYLHAKKDVALQLESGKKQLSRNKYSRYFAYFQQETCTSVPHSVLLPQIRNILVEDNCVGLILSTRPDFVSDELLEKLANLFRLYKKECLFELGLQSVHQRSLDLLNRNHTYNDFTDTVRRIRNYECFQIGAHLIFGIPGESEEEMMTSVREVCKHGVNALKLHHLQVLNNTVLYDMYRRGEVTPLSVDYYFEFLLKIIPRIPREIVIHRLWATSHPDLLVAPKWNVLATVLSRKLRFEMERRGLAQGQCCC